MDAHRLRSVLDLVISEHARLGVDHKLAQVLQALSVCVSSPSGGSDEQFRMALTDMLTALRRARTNDFVESNRRILVEIQGERLTGNGLAERVLDVANQRPFLAAHAREMIVGIADDLQRGLGVCASATASLEHMNIGPVHLEPDVYELGLLLPDSLVRGDLERLVNELKEWNRLLRELMPMVSALPPVVALRTHSANRFELSVRLDRDGALALGTIIARIHDLFGKVQANRRQAAELERQSYPPELVGHMMDYEKLIVPQGLRAIREVVTAKFLKSDKRRKEILKVLDRSLRFLAIRIRDGVEVEIQGPQTVDAAAIADERTPAGEAGEALPHHVRAALQTARCGPAAGPTQPGATAAPASEEKAVHLPLSTITGESDRQQAA